MKQWCLSLKQPWATLLVHGLKTVEVRKWPARHRGRILIHAARVPDSRPEARAQVPAHLEDAAQRMGGIVGAGELIDCVTYRNRAAFVADQARHLNEPSWFEGPALYGFVFTHLTPLPFRRYPGWMRFFEVEAEEDRGSRIVSGIDPSTICQNGRERAEDGRRRPRR